MHPAATLFLDVGVQADLWPDGVWPLVGADQVRNIVRLFGIADVLELRQGGIVCRHVSASSKPCPGSPVHCQRVESACDRPSGCLPRLPMSVWTEDAESEPTPPLDREHAVYLDSGCGQFPDEHPHRARAFEHLTSGVRDTVVFGAGVEHGIDRVVDALLRRRIRTHVVLDAVGAADQAMAQMIISRWKRRGVDGLTVDMVDRLLREK